MTIKSDTSKRIKAITKIQRALATIKNILLCHESLPTLMAHKQLFKRFKNEQNRIAYNDYKKFMRNKKIISENVISFKFNIDDDGTIHTPVQITNCANNNIDDVGTDQSPVQNTNCAANNIADDGTKHILDCLY